MVHPELIKWTQAQRADFTDEQIKEALVRSGHPEADVEVALHGNEPKHGTIFNVLYFIMVGFFILQIAGGFLYSVITLNFISILITMAFGGLFIYFLVKKKIYETLTEIFVLSPDVFFIWAILPMLASFIEGISSSFVYIFIAFYVGLTGLVIHYMFNKICDTKKYIITGVIMSSLLALAFAVNAGVVWLFNTVVTDIGVMLAHPTFNPYVGFIIAFLFFNISFAYFYMKKEHNHKMLALFGIPIVVYIVFAVILTLVFKAIAPGAIL